MTIFQKIIDREIPAEIVYEDDQCLAFKDINPQAPSHLLIIPKRPIATLADLKPEDAGLMGHMMVKASELAANLGFADRGYRTVINCKKDGGQEVYHLHIHLMAGRKMTWPPG